MKTKRPDYNHSLANLASSILKYWGIEPKNNTYKSVDELLNKNYKNVVVLLLDGMGKCILDHNFDDDSFFKTHLKETYSSVFPPTTVAATTSICSGLTPAQHAWLGWDCYYPQIDENVTVFLNTIQGSSESAADYNVAQTYCGYDSLVKQINDHNGQAYEITPFAEPFYRSFDEICSGIKEKCALDGKKYIYAYWDEPDHTMHEKGCYVKETKDVLHELEAKVKQLANDLDDTLLIVTADHGHVDSKGVCIDDYPKIMECLVRRPSIEPRTLNFFIKDGMNEQFVSEFNKEFKDKFELYTKEEILDKQLFGIGEIHDNFEDMLGDYLAIATDDLCIYNSRELANKFIGVHAGLTEDEMVIPLIVIEK